MDFDIRCECGQYIVVSEGAAGARLKCACGRTVDIPALDKLRTEAGLPPSTTEARIAYLLSAGHLPGTKSCACCRADADRTIEIVTECERAWIHQSGGRTWVSLLGFILTALISPIAVWLREERSQQIYGQDKIYHLPLPVCTKCTPKVRGTKAIKQYLRQIPEYRWLLDKFPDARVVVSKVAEAGNPERGAEPAAAADTPP
jgi:hypothetical protein